MLICIKKKREKMPHKKKLECKSLVINKIDSIHVPTSINYGV